MSIILSQTHSPIHPPTISTTTLFHTLSLVHPIDLFLTVSTCPLQSPALSNPFEPSLTTPSNPPSNPPPPLPLYDPYQPPPTLSNLLLIHLDKSIEEFKAQVTDELVGKTVAFSLNCDNDNTLGVEVYRMYPRSDFSLSCEW